MDAPEVTQEWGAREDRVGYPDRLGISEELRRHRFLQQPHMKKQLDDFSQELINPKRKRIIKSLANLCTASFLVTVGHLPLQVLLTSVHCPATLGQISLAVLYGTLAVSSALSGAILRYLSPKLTLLCGTASHMLFIAANIQPSYKTLIPASVLSGIGNGLMWHVYTTMINSLALRYSIGSSASPRRTFHSVFLIVHEAAFLLGNSYTSFLLFTDNLSASFPARVLNDSSAPLSSGWFKQTCMSWNSSATSCNPGNTSLQSLDPLLISYSLFVTVGFLLVLFGITSPDIVFQQASASAAAPVGVPGRSVSRVGGKVSVAMFCCFHGLHQAFVLGDITKLMSSTAGIRMVGLAMSCYGIARLPWVLVSGSRWGKKTTGTFKFCVLGFALVLACYVFTLSIDLHRPALSVLLPMVCVWGLADGCMEQLIPGMCQEYSLKSHVGIASTGLRALGMAVGLGCAPFVCPVYRLYGLIGTVIVGFVAYTVVSPCSDRSCTKTADHSTDV